MNERKGKFREFVEVWIIVQEVLGQVSLLQFLRSEHVLSKTETQRKYTSNNALNLDVLSKWTPNRDHLN